MPRGNHLTEREKGNIQALHQQGKSLREIAACIKRSVCAVQNFLKNPFATGPNKRQGRKRKLSQRTERQVVNSISNTRKSCNNIINELNLCVSKTTIWRTLKRNEHIVRAKMTPAPRLEDRHITARLEFARNNMNRNWDTVSHTLLFSFHCFDHNVPYIFA